MHKIDNASSNMTPREIVAELDRHIIGQHAAKRAVSWMGIAMLTSGRFM